MRKDKNFTDGGIDVIIRNEGKTLLAKIVFKSSYHCIGLFSHSLKSIAPLFRL